MGLLEYVLSQAMLLYSYALIVYILMSWFPGARESQIGILLGRICEPYLEQFRKIIPPLGMIDISPIIALVVLNFARLGLSQLFQMLGW